MKKLHECGDVFPIILLSYLYERNDYNTFVLFILTDYMPSVKVELIKACQENWLWQGHGVGEMTASWLGCYFGNLEEAS